MNNNKSLDRLLAWCKANPGEKIHIPDERWEATRNPMPLHEWAFDNGLDFYCQKCPKTHIPGWLVWLKEVKP
jgi:hypothetical protein